VAQAAVGLHLGQRSLQGAGAEAGQQARARRCVQGAWLRGACI
jgi:hypothetical protein